MEHKIETPLSLATTPLTRDTKRTDSLCRASYMKRRHVEDPCREALSDLQSELDSWVSLTELFTRPASPRRQRSPESFLEHSTSQPVHDDRHVSISIQAVTFRYAIAASYAAARDPLSMQHMHARAAWGSWLPFSFLARTPAGVVRRQGSRGYFVCSVKGPASLGKSIFFFSVRLCCLFS